MSLIGVVDRVITSPSGSKSLAIKLLVIGSLFSITKLSSIPIGELLAISVLSIMDKTTVAVSHN